MVPPEISFIILTWNSDAYLSKCFDSIIKKCTKERISYELVVVDNGSQDRSRSIIREYHENHPGTFKCIFLESNHGTTFPRNLGIRNASGNFFCIIDSDTELAEGSLFDILSRLNEEAKIGIIAPRLLLPDGTVQHSVKRFPTMLHKLLKIPNIFLGLSIKNVDFYEGFPFREERIADSAISACWFFSRKLVQEVGVLDENIFYSPEDLDYSIRVWKAGYSILYYPECTVIHHTQQITHKKPFSKTSFNHFMGLIYYYLKHGGWLIRPRITAVVDICKLARRTDRTMHPRISFIVPCYNLAHLLTECVESILSQTYVNFEILIMDDCSPDNTPEMANSFNDHRVIHVRNETNLRHLANYNKGIGIARGEFIWLISADDRLRTPYVLQQYVRHMDAHPEVGFVFSSAMGLKNGIETEIVNWAYHGPHDAIIKGHEFLQLLMKNNCVAAPSGMVRRELYEREMFPLDMPYAGDWYLWCLFSLHGDVTYFSEPMVCYREHDSSMTNKLRNQDQRILVNDDMKVLWRVYGKLKDMGLSILIKACAQELIRRYALDILKEERNRHGYGLSLACLDRGFLNNIGNDGFAAYLRAGILTILGDYHHSSDNSLLAVRYYGTALRNRPTSISICAKYLLERMGRYGQILRNIGSNVSKIMQGVMNR